MVDPQFEASEGFGSGIVEGFGRSCNLALVALVTLPLSSGLEFAAMG